jgi:DNA modification methylase
MDEINFALVEDVRPPIYTAMKYWGKKPHNIWRNYIENYTPENGLYLDPFAGSAMSAFEAFKVNRTAVVFDLNPLTSFIIEVFVTAFNQPEFTQAVDDIMAAVEKDAVYQNYFFTESRRAKKLVPVVCWKWNSGQLYELGVQEIEIKNGKTIRYTVKPNKQDMQKAKLMNGINIPFWYPHLPFPNSPSFSANFIQNIGRNNFSNLWTRRNLYVISKIFDEILTYRNEPLKKQLLFGFIQMVHLCTKMSIPRRPDANRDFSTSWGRSAYIAAARQMEMNPLMVFRGSCFGKQSVESCLKSIPNYLGKMPKLVCVGTNNKQKDKLTGFDIKYGAVDVNTILDYIPEQSVDFILTDPPYGGLVQYLDLSMLWLNWLAKVDRKYQPNFAAEMTIKKGKITTETYKRRFTNALKNLYKLLKPEGKIVFTFHNKNLEIWNAFLKSVMLAGFRIEKVIHQQNRRTGEANVANPYGTSATDFYIRCVKSDTMSVRSGKEEFEHFVITKAIEMIALRNEPTPYQFLFNGLLAEISAAGFDLDDFDDNLQRILEKQVGKIFVLSSNENNKAGNYWWFAEPKQHIKYPDKALTDRVEDSIVALLRRKITVSFDDVLGDIFQRYPNGLTPDIRSIDAVLKKYAVRSNGKWLYNVNDVESHYSRHSEMLYALSKIGHKLGYKVFIGKREQSENYKGDKKLSECADWIDLNFLAAEKDKRCRLEMVDMIWLENQTIKYVIEVENTTKFTAGIQRGSNVEVHIPKLMVIPDERESELLRISDPLFIESFKVYHWKYLFYSDIESIAAVRNVGLSHINMYAKDFRNV